MPPDQKDSTHFLHEIELGLGAMAWGDRMVWNYGKDYNDSDLEAGFRVSLDNGVNFVDTAEIYGNGRSERLLGQMLTRTQTPVIVATKFFPFPWRWTKTSVVQALRSSLERLGLERTDLYQVHWPSPLVPVENYAEGLASAHRLGLARAVGVSNFDKNQMQQAYTVLAKYDIPLASNQLEYNLLNRSIEKSGLLARCQELGIRVIAYSPLAMGLLTGKFNPENPPLGLRARKYGSILKEIQPLVHLLTNIGQDLGGKSAAQVALNWTICKGTLPIPGAKTLLQADMNSRASGWRLSEDQIHLLDEASDQFLKK
ncbi:MAG TPA: aldo/keto reductase [Anaerolineales bacterium]